MPIVETGVETMENDTQNGGVILPRRSDLPDWGPDFRPHSYFKRKFILLEKLVILLKNVTMCQFIHAKFHAELLDIRPRHAYPALAYLHARYSRGKGGEGGGRATQQSFKCGGSPHTSTHEILIQSTLGDSNPL